MFVQIVGKGYINVNNVVMVSSKNDDGKYMITLSHGGKIIVNQKVRDKIIHSYDCESSMDMDFVNERLRKNAIISVDLGPKDGDKSIEYDNTCPKCGDHVQRCMCDASSEVKSDE